MKEKLSGSRDKVAIRSSDVSRYCASGSRYVGSGLHTGGDVSQYVGRVSRSAGDVLQSRATGLRSCAAGSLTSAPDRPFLTRTPDPHASPGTSFPCNGGRERLHRTLIKTCDKLRLAAAAELLRLLGELHVEAHKGEGNDGDIV